MDRLPGCRDAEPLWLWSSRAAAAQDETDRAWQAFLRRFDIEHTFRFLRQQPGWTRPKLRDPAADRWTWLVIAACAQLYLARDLAADTGCNGRPLGKYARLIAITVEVAARNSPHSFQVLRRRWVAERTFGWLMRYRRLCRDYERRPGHHEAMVYWATVFIMTKRLARYETGQPGPPRWGGERPRPAQQTTLSTGSERSLMLHGLGVAATRGAGEPNARPGRVTGLWRVI